MLIVGVYVAFGSFDFIVFVYWEIERTSIN